VVVTEVVETAFDVSLYDPRIRQPAPPTVLIALMRHESHADVLQSAMGAPSGPEPVGDIPKLRLEDWLHESFDRALNDAVFDRGYTEWSELTRFSSLGD
jgi:hypothetical protein